ncbi:hypothetical protein HPP92_013570 [Vanilla planifolia]|uniref:Uncharacterized protein n=1 Tax=Vanilla planifolia TaxID=51239 RepID=A0A835QSK3_VANPL|nr:hypothetical protein HPP92_026829 [Vanilla planifolia]KAG0478851.1 hypothetical protein HPP92_013570 [Vanilla planifolia]
MTELRPNTSKASTTATTDKEEERTRVCMADKATQELQYNVLSVTRRAMIVLLGFENSQKTKEAGDGRDDAKL